MGYTFTERVYENSRKPGLEGLWVSYNPYKIVANKKDYDEGKKAFGSKTGMFRPDEPHYGVSLNQKNEGCFGWDTRLVVKLDSHQGIMKDEKSFNEFFEGLNDMCAVAGKMIFHPVSDDNADREGLPSTFKEYQALMKDRLYLNFKVYTKVTQSK